MMRLEARAALTAWRGVGFAVEATGIAPADAPYARLYLLVTGCNVPGALAAEVAGCTKQNVSKACRAIEDRRDTDPSLDALLERLEHQLMGD